MNRKYGVYKGRSIHFFKRSIVNDPFSVICTGAGTYGTYAYNDWYQLSFVPNVSEFTNLYDSYRISGIKITFIPRGNSSDFNPDSLNNRQVIPMMHVAYDYDGDNSAPTLAELSQYPSYRCYRMDRPHSLYIKNPAVRMQVGTQDPATGDNSLPRVQKSRQWIDCQATTIPHFGLRFVWSGNTNFTYQFTVVYTYYLQFKGVR